MSSVSSPAEEGAKSSTPSPRRRSMRKPKIAGDVSLEAFRAQAKEVSELMKNLDILKTL